MAAATSSFLTHVNATSNCDLTEYISAAVNGTSGELKEYLRQLSWEKLVDLWPSVAVVSLLILLGVPGNALVFLMFWRYFKPSSTRVFVLSMAVCDLFTSMLSSPCYVIQTRFLYDLGNTYFCHSTFVIHRLPVIASGWLLVAVALDRHHRVCLPFSRQLNPGQALCLVLTALVLACGATLPFIPLHREITVSTPRGGLCGQRCGITQRYSVSAHGAAEWWILTLSFTIGFLLLVSSYLHIGCRLYSHRSRTQTNLPAESEVQTGDDNRHKPAPFGDEDENTDRKGENDSGHTVSKDGWEFADEDITTSTATAKSQRHLAQLTSSSVAETLMSSLENSMTEGASVDSCHKQRADRSNVSRRRVGKKIPTRTTLMMFVLTVTAIVTYLPFVVLSFFSGDDVSTYCLRMDGWPMNWCMTALYFVNVSSVVNPFIYSFCNPAFRHECRRLFVALRTSVATSGDEEYAESQRGKQKDWKVEESRA